MDKTIEAARRLLEVLVESYGAAGTLASTYAPAQAQYATFR